MGAGGDDAKDLLSEETEADLSHIFDEGGVSTASRVTDGSKQGSLNTNLHHDASATVSSLAEEMLLELGGGRKEHARDAGLSGTLHKTKCSEGIEERICLDVALCKGRKNLTSQEI